MKKYIVEHEFDGYEIGTYLKETKGFSSRGLRNLEIYLNGKKIKNNAKKIKKLNRIVIIEKEKSTGIKAMDIPIEIAYEDENFLIVNKEPYIIVHPTQKKVDKTLANAIVNYFEKTMGKTLVPRFYNRLDMNTSGLIIVTKNAYSQAFLQEKTEVKKAYMALVDGIVEKDNFLIDIPIGKIGDELRRVKLEPENGGQSAQTEIKVIKRFENKNFTLIEAKLLTGRTHQIRAHLSLTGHTLLGDELYGGNMKLARRQMLHAYKLEFKNPRDNEIIKIEIDLPEDMKRLIK
ncbi:MAG: RluA family pseudouridine synthase [Fusobacterium sp.]|uniref:RluA family pseudouridine synthase n=1 Tax=Fusobacterium sp. TaxID=68766 RepID=UPI0026DD2D0D|nr:RluA family pseudouridine synthase [Fusobacterium sp.]MDO4689695.1 RluA family pseudouridine synthase [Fusobacterium sp.]